MGQQYFVRIVELPGRVHDCLWRFGRSAGRHPTRHLSAQAVAKTVPSCRAQSRDTGITWVGTTLLHRGKLVPRRHGRTKQCFGVPLGGIRKGAPLRSPVRACGGLPPSEYSDPGKPSTQVMSRCQAADRATGPLVGRERRPPFPKKQTCMSPHPSRNQEILASESTNPSARTGIRRGTWELSLAEGCSEGLGRTCADDRPEPVVSFGSDSGGKFAHGLSVRTEAGGVGFRKIRIRIPFSRLGDLDQQPQPGLDGAAPGERG